MHISKKVISMALSLAFLIGLLATPLSFGSAAEEELTSLAYSNNFDGSDPTEGLGDLGDHFRIASGHYLDGSSIGGNAVATVNNTLKDYVLEFRAYIDTYGTQSGCGLNVQVRDKLFFKLCPGTLGVQDTNSSADGWPDYNWGAGVAQKKWIDVRILVYDKTITAYVDNVLVSSTTRDAFATYNASNITFSVWDARFNLDDIKVSEILKYSAGFNRWSGNTDEDHVWDDQGRWVGSANNNYIFYADFKPGEYNGGVQDGNWNNYGFAAAVKTGVAVSLKNKSRGVQINNDYTGYDWGTGIGSYKNQWLALKFKVDGNKADAYINGNLFVTRTDAAIGSAAAGDMSFGAWNEEFDLKNLVITKVSPTYSNDFEGTDPLTTGMTVTDEFDLGAVGELVCDGLGGAITLDNTYNDFLLTAKLRVDNVNPENAQYGGSANIKFNVPESGNGGYAFMFTGGWVTAIQRCDNAGSWGDRLKEGPNLGLGVWNNIAIRKVGGDIKIYINDELKISYTDASPWGKGSIKFDLWNTAFSVDDIAIYTKPHSVTVSSNDTTMGTVTGGGKFNNGEDATVTATVANADDYKFVKWVKVDGSNETEVSTDASYTFTPTDDVTLKAIFAEKDKYMVSVAADPVDGGTVTGTAEVEPGTEVTVKAVANSYFEFVKWVKVVDGTETQVSTSAEYKFTVSEDISLVAKFKTAFHGIDEDFEGDDAGKDFLIPQNAGYKITKDPTNPNNKVLEYDRQGNAGSSFGTVANGYNNFTLTARLYLKSSQNGGNVGIGMRTGGNAQVSAEFSSWKGRLMKIAGNNKENDTYLDFAIPEDAWSNVKVVASGDLFEIYINGSRVAYHTFTGVDAGGINFGNWNQGYYLDDVKVVEDVKPYSETGKFEEDFSKSPVTVTGNAPYVINRKMKDFILEFTVNVKDIKKTGDQYDDNRGPAIEIFDGVVVKLSRGFFGMECKAGMGYDAPWDDYVRTGMGSLIGKWATVKIVAEGDTVSIYVNDQKAFTKSADFIKNGKPKYISFGGWDTTYLLGKISMMDPDDAVKEDPARDFIIDFGDTPLAVNGNKPYTIDRLMKNFTMEFTMKMDSITQKGDDQDLNRGAGIKISKTYAVVLKRGYFGMDGYANPWDDYERTGMADLIGKWITVKIVKNGETVTIYINGQKAFSKSDAKFKSDEAANISFGGWDCDYQIGKIKLTSPDKIDPNSPNTGDPTVPVSAALLMLAAGSAIVLTIKKRK